MIDYDYIKAESLEQVLRLLKQYGRRATLVAGGTDVLVQIRNTKKAPDVLISLRGLKELAYIRKNKGYHIGALTSHRMLHHLEPIVPF